MNNGLLIPDANERMACERQMTVSADSLNVADFPGWEDIAKQNADRLLKAIAVELQTQNDCAANMTATSEEARQYLLTGTMTQLARTYAYNACEWISGKQRRIGQDAGLTIDSTVLLMTKGIPDLGVEPGLPTEEAYKYGTYERNAQRFVERAKSAVIVPSSVRNHGPLPTADKLPLACAVGGSGHIGVFWAPKFETRTFLGRRWKVWTSTPTSGGGHALVGGIFCLWIPEQNEWWPCIWNSHGDGPILIPPDRWDVYVKRNWQPFGGYLMLPDKPEEKWHDRVQSGGGYFRPRNQGVA
jgi:hypothetical protein